MKIRQGFVLREIDGTGVVVPVGKASVEFHGMITLNPTGTLMWNLLRQDTSHQQLVQALIDAYGIERAVAQRDVSLFLQKLSQAGLLEETYICE